MVIDANMYWFPEEIFKNEELMWKFLSEIPQGYETKGYTMEISRKKQIIIEKPRGYQSLNYLEGEYLLEKQLQDMDEAGIDKAVLKLPGCHEWMSLRTCKRFNDAMAEHVKRSNGRMVALGVVPPWESPENFEEIERCKYELDMKGIQLTTHYGKLYLDDEAFMPFFEKLNELEMTVYVHHSPVPVQYESFYQYNNLRRSYGRCLDQVIAVGRELFSGFISRYPKIMFVHSMLGGGIFVYFNMLFPSSSKQAERVNRFDVGVEEIKACFSNNLFFELSHAQPWGKAQIECAVRVLGADRILFGSSYPVRKEWLIDGPDFIRQLDISETEKAMILGENAKKVYGL
jgi:hypothetical protein